MKNLIRAVAATVLFAAPLLGFTCEYPERPSLPDGSKASKEEMIAGQTAVKAFLADIDVYLDCIEEEERDAIKGMPKVDESDADAVNARVEEIKRREDLLTKRFDAANEEKFLFGEKWNQQVRAYNARKSGQSSE